jgi:serine protease
MKFKDRIAIVVATCAVMMAADVAPAQAPGPDAQSVDQLIVKYRKEPGAAGLAAKVGAAENIAARFGSGVSYKRKGSLGFHVLKIDRRISVKEMERLAAELEAGDPSIEYAEPDLVMVATMTPNDPQYSQQWHYYENTGGVRAPQAWDLAAGSGIRVAVLDTGYRPHADLVANLVGGYDFISETDRAADGGGRDSDPSDPGDFVLAGVCANYPDGTTNTWHGTHVAGTVAAVTNNSNGVAGLAFGSQVVPVRVLGKCGGLSSDIADAINWASGGSVGGVPANPHPAKILSLSLSSRTAGACGSTYQNAINAANSRGSLVVIAAGNENATQDHSPGNCAGVITVAATNRAGGKASYSNTGSRVEISGPGGDGFDGVLSTSNDGTYSIGSDSYRLMQGTSMATPHVSGTLALMWSRTPSLSASQIKNTLYATARSFPASCPGCGVGIVDAGAAVYALGIPGANIFDAGPAGCNGSYSIYWNAVAGATSYKVWRKTPSQSEISYYNSSSGTSALVFVPNGAGLTYFHVQACQGASCGIVGQPASLPYYSGCP